MSRKQKRADRRDEEPKKAEPAFRNTGLAAALGRWKVEQKADKPAPPPSPSKKAPPPPQPKKLSKAELDDAAADALFVRAMGEVDRLPDDTRVVTPLQASVRIQEVNEDAEALARLAELVAGGEGIDLADTDEYAEGVARGVDPGLLEPLRRGDFSVQAHVDLHGLAREPAREELEKFLVESRRKGLRCVLVVHGRGLHSKDQIPVLKERMETWLSRGRLSRMVLAFATARPTDGGAGAMYVLLRR